MLGGGEYLGQHLARFLAPTGGLQHRRVIEVLGCEPRRVVWQRSLGGGDSLRDVLECAVAIAAIEQ